MNDIIDLQLNWKIGNFPQLISFIIKPRQLFGNNQDLKVSFKMPCCYIKYGITVEQVR